MGRDEFCEFMFAHGLFVFARGLSMFAHCSSVHQKCSNYALTNLFGLCKSV
jgi:hypothetical protein